jgi:hypothetical protein
VRVQIARDVDLDRAAPPPAHRPVTAASTRWRGPRAVLALLIAGGALTCAVATWRFGRPASGVRPAAGAEVRRAGVRLAEIERISPARGRGRLPIYLAPFAGPLVDSARVGALAARLVPGSAAAGVPVVELVPRDSVAGLALVARLVVTPGEPGLLVFGPR